jgi:predicted Rossmann fold nucleotide-binding protein DprA/Smf involved in DNA uptake
VLFSTGALALLGARPVVAVVGTRRCTPEGARVAYELAYDLSSAGACVVSGLALGIDGAAHAGALAAVRDATGRGGGNGTCGPIGSGGNGTAAADAADATGAVAGDVRGGDAGVAGAAATGSVAADAAAGPGATDAAGATAAPGADAAPGAAAAPGADAADVNAAAAGATDVAAVPAAAASAFAVGTRGRSARGAKAGGSVAGKANCPGPVGKANCPGSTVGVAASGVDVVYPRQHAALWREVARLGAVVSETPLGAPAQPWRFPSRNRLIAGLAQMVVVVECHVSGGSWHTVEAALSRGVEVGAVPGPVYSPACAGTNTLLHEGAVPVRNAQDVLDVLGIFDSRQVLGPQGPGAYRKPQLAPLSGPLGALDDKVLAAIGCRSLCLDEIVERSGLPVTAVVVSLDRLEQAGAVSGGAGWWSRMAR